MPVIASKIRTPSPPERVVGRPRLAEHIAELADLHGVVWVTGGAGAGKTTAVAEAVAGFDRPLAWLNLDTSERAAGRLLVYLEAALAQALPNLPPVATAALASDVPHVEAAGMLAEAVAGRALTLVVDEVERIADSDEALETLSNFVRYAPLGLRVVLISRRRVALRLGSVRGVGGIARVDESQLAFTVEEAEAALDRLGFDPDIARSAVEATGGWVAGVLFDGWRAPGNDGGNGEAASALSSYFSSEIMAELTGRQQDFLVATSVLGTVTPERAEALGEIGATDVLRALRARHLPVSFAGDELTMRCHRQFREYLQEQLREGTRRDIRAIQSAHGQLLVSEGRHEDAVDVLLDAGALEAAEEAAAVAAEAVLRRQDFSVVERWLRSLRREAIDQSEPLTVAEMLLGIEREEFVRAAECADRLLADHGETFLDPELAVPIASSFFQTGRLDDALGVIDRAPETPQTRALRFSLRVDVVDDPTHYRERPPDSGHAVDGLLARVDLAHGRFDRLLEPASKAWAANHSSRAGALRALGRLDEALELCRNPAYKGWTFRRIHVEILADLNQREEAWDALHAGHEIAERSGWGFQMFGLLLEAVLSLRFERDTAQAEAALARVEREPTALRRMRIVEQLHLWRGLIGLLDDNSEAAAQQLRTAVEFMVASDRLLFLPTAAVYLAEAEWRLEQETAADQAADLALATAQRQGSNHLLLQALREFPAVASRRLDAEPGADSPWHEIGRTLMAGSLTPSGRLIARTHLVEFGAPRLSVDGADVEIKLSKSIELMAYLASHGHRATKSELLEQMFDGRTDDSTRSYLRQALNRLRQALPADAPLTVEGDHVAWSGGTLTSESMELASAVRQAAELRGRSRLEATLTALAPYELGEYLPEAASEWVEERRAELRELANDARHAAAEAAFELGDYQQADELARRVLENDPDRETVWRLSMRIAGAMGSDDRVIARYRGCERALAQFGARPAASTRELLDRLRR